MIIKDKKILLFRGPTLIEYLNSLPSCHGSIDGPLRMLIIERYKVRLQDEGVIVIGKIESGTCRVGDKCLIMPNRTHVEVTNIYSEEIETDSCVCGDNIRLKLKNVKEEVREIVDNMLFLDAFVIAGNRFWIYSM
jgi:peptide chain release factor subunit 3